MLHFERQWFWAVLPQLAVGEETVQAGLGGNHNRAGPAQDRHFLNEHIVCISTSATVSH